MDMIYKLMVRNMKVYLRDRTSVFFSFLSVLVIIGMYVLFLGDMTASNVNDSIGAPPEDVRWMVDSWIMAGIMVVNAMTVTLGALGVLVDDESQGRLASFLVSPVQRRKIVQGYLAAAMTIGILLGIAALILSQLYIVVKGGAFLSAASLLKVLALQVLNVFSSGSIVFFLVSLVRTPGAFGTLSTLVGTLVGFFAGIYIPIGVMPAAVQTFMKFNPLTHGAALMRQVYMEAPLEKILGQAPPEVREGIEETFGISIFQDGTALSFEIMLLVVAGSGLLFLLFSIIRMNHRKLG